MMNSYNGILKGLFLSFLIVGCSQVDSSDEKKVEEQKTPLNKECVCDSLEIDDSGLAHYEDELFSGICYSHYPNTEVKYMEIGYSEGKRSGSLKVFDKLGKLIKEEEVEQNTSSGEKNGFIVCHCDSLGEKSSSYRKKMLKMYQSEPFTGKCFSYYPETKTKYMETEYKNGFADGYMYIYDKTGKIIYSEKYVQGVALKAPHN